jgi:hypothetical protein
MYMRARADRLLPCPATIWATPNIGSNPRHGRVLMASFNRERVEHALNELLVRIVPEEPDEDEEVANERYDAAYDHAYRELSDAGDLRVVADINHVASQIDRRCEAAFWISDPWLTVRSAGRCGRAAEKRTLQQPAVPAGVAAGARPEMAHAVLSPRALRHTARPRVFRAPRPRA